MRNWHHVVIKLSEARNLIEGVDVNLKDGDSNIYVGVIEDYMQYVPLLENTPPLTVDKYESAHASFSNIGGIKKVFFRGINKDTFNEILGFNDLKFPEAHTVAVAGIIGGNCLGNGINGIAANIRIINSADNNIIFLTTLALAKIGKFTAGNMVKHSPYYANLNDVKFILGNIPIENSHPIEPYSSASVSVINCSFNSDTLLDVSVDFIMRELFAYGDNGRGTLIIAAAGNESRTITKENSSYFFSNKPLVIAASKVTLDVNHLDDYIGSTPIAFNESYADYSNKGERIDLCAPSGPDRYPSRGDIEIYGPTILNGGQIGSDDQIILSTVKKRNNNSTLVLEHLDKRIMKGQSIELGSPNSFFHEITYISDVKEELFDGQQRSVVYLDDNLKFTRDNSNTSYSIEGKEVRITIFKKEIVQKIEENKLVLKDFRGIGSVQISKKQDVFIYAEGDSDNGIMTTIINTMSTSNKIEVSHSLSALGPGNLVLIPGQFKIKMVKVLSTSTSHFRAAPGYTTQGFFTGQLVMVEGSLKHITVDGATLYFKHFGVTEEPGEPGPTPTYSLSTTSYGNYTSSFTGTSAATPIVSGLAALVKSVNSNLNAIEIKHILKNSTDKIGGSYSLQNDDDDYNYGYEINSRYGTGRINALKAVELALDWHSSSPTVIKPTLAIADKLDGGYTGNIIPVGTNDPVDSPDIWVKKLNDTNQDLPSLSSPFNIIATEVDQKIFIRVRNEGGRRSFAENDVRVFVAFTDDLNPAFSFPDNWYNQTFVKLIDVKQVGYIEPGGEKTITVEWKNIKANWDIWNPADTQTKHRKKTYILAHIAPFDGPADKVELDNLRNNKQLTCKEIIMTHAGMRYSGIVVPGNTYDIPLEAAVTERQFDFDISNVAAHDLAGLNLKFTKKSRADGAEQSVIYSKDGDIWSVAGGEVPWITFAQPMETDGTNAGYKNIVFPHTLTINEDEENIKLEII